MGGPGRERQTFSLLNGVGGEVDESTMIDTGKSIFSSYPRARLSNTWCAMFLVVFSDL